MALQVVKAIDTKTGGEATVEYDFGDNYQDACAKFGEDVVFSQYKQQVVIAAQSVMRGYIRKGYTAEQIAEKMAAWKPGIKVAREASDVTAAAIAKFAKMSPEDQAKFIAGLQAKMQG